MHPSENISMALFNIRKNKMRSILTMTIIAFGIMALVGILTSIDTILYSMNDNFSSLGSNAFGVSRIYEKGKGRSHGNQRKTGKPINFQEAIRFKEQNDFAGAKTAISFKASRSSTVKYNKIKSNPTVGVKGIDENFYNISKREIVEGRNFSTNELNNGAPKAILGFGYGDLFFNDNITKSIGKVISIDNKRYEVIGVLKSQGSSMNSNADLDVLIPLKTAKKIYGYESSNYYVDVAVMDVKDMDDAISNAIGVMRNVRGLRTSQENDFQIKKSDGILSILKDMTFELRLAAIVIGLMTLVGAAIGLMNIMLQSVTDRTREIGIIKALGATKKDILLQFMTEAVVISILGGIMGIILGIFAGNIVTLLIGGAFLIPWGWITLGVVVCLIVGIISGWYPAFKAANLDPIESLRYE